MSDRDRAAKWEPQGDRPTTVGKACELFLRFKLGAFQAGEISKITMYEYQRTCERVVEFFRAETLLRDLSPSAFTAYRVEAMKRLRLVALGNEVTRVKSIFRWVAAEHGVTVNFGVNFKKSSARLIRREKRLRGKKLFSANEIRLTLDEAGIHLKAMIMLGINCGFGPKDCAMLPISAVDLESGWIEYPRPKTEVDRIIPLWPETVEALKASASRRYPERVQEDRFFVLYDGRFWDYSNLPISKHFTHNGRRVGLQRGGFYWLRHTFATIASGVKDQIAVNAIMGHVDGSIAAVYREEIDLCRLEAVVEHVRKWLFEESQEVPRKRSA